MKKLLAETASHPWQDQSQNSPQNTGRKQMSAALSALTLGAQRCSSAEALITPTATSAAMKGSSGQRANVAEHVGVRRKRCFQLRARQCAQVVG